MMKPSKTLLMSIPLYAAVACGPGTSSETSGEEPTGTTADPGSTSSGSTPVSTSSATTTADGSTGDTTGSATGGLPLDLPDECSTIEQDCPPGYKCMPLSNDGGPAWNDAMCVPIDPDPSAPGEPCTVQGGPTTGHDDCDGTSMCWDVDVETLEGTCVSFCIGTLEDPTCPNPCDYCTISAEGVVNICFDGCDPIMQSCPDGQACYAANDRFACIADASQGAGVGDPCEYINACPAGTLCVQAGTVPDCDGSTGCCAPVCEVGAVDPCPGLLPGTECTPWYDGGIPEEVCLTDEPGICALPM